MKSTYSLILDHKVLLNRRPCTHIGYWNNIRKDVSRNGLLNSSMAGHCRLFQKLFMLGKVNVV